MLEILTPATTSDLMLLEELQAEPWIEAGTPSATLSRLLVQASSAIEALWGQPLGRQRYRATLPSFGGGTLELPRFPIIVIEGSPTVLVDDSAVEDVEVEDAIEGTLFRPLGFDWSARRGGRFQARPMPGSEERRIEVTWWAGYKLPGDTEAPAAARGLPPLLARACQVTVKAWHLDDGRDAAVSSLSQTFSGGSAETGGAGSSAITFAAASAQPRAVPPEALALIRAARR